MWLRPVVTADTPDVRPLTCTGAARLVTVPSPSWPDLLAPQHFTPDVGVSAHTWASPVATCNAVIPWTTRGFNP